MQYNFMKGEINTGETEIKEIKVYLDGESKMADVSEDFKRNLMFPSFNEPLSIGQEIRLDVVLKDGTICENKEVLVISEDKIIVPTLKCDYNQKKDDWCVGDLVWGTHCEEGEWVEFIDVDCNYWKGTCKNGNCVESGNENNILILTDLDNKHNPPMEAIGDLNIEAEDRSIVNPNESESTELIQNQSEENSPTNLIGIVLNWLINLF